MDWNFKPNSGYLSEFDQESVPEISSMDGSISFESPTLPAKGECSFDLKLGHVGNYSASSNRGPVMSSTKWKEAAGSKPESSSGSGSSKRARGSGNGNLTAFCLVDGCNADLSNCREYHRRHKVCEVHSKTPVVTINGQKQRFCQQCSRFHSLEEFDEGKRSCRKRLDGHNRRRRKPQPDPISRPASFLTSFQGTKLLQFSSSHVFPTTTVVSPGWASGGVSTAVNGVSYSQNQSFHSPIKPGVKYPVSSPSSSSYKTGKQFPFLQDDSPSSHNRSSTWCERLTNCIQDSDCALSLLSSSSSQQTQSTNFGLGQHHVLQQPGSVPLMLQPLPSLGHGPVDSVVYGSGLFENAAASDGSVVSGNEAVTPHTFPFHWE